ncbi:hypothetical protein [Lewinella sp. JB7]|uniref:hypothetical protein n=1 Tax=Lewinella sp. JB7 TaxID=2962887 RepID=UPI0020C99D50|nr:hypothetical protein [Lewinella sp. JB7]MCP9234580.1 hypothetical protein [Lewinella sp. JB7]
MTFLLRALTFLMFVSLIPGPGSSCTEDQRIDFSSLERQLMIVWIATDWHDASVQMAYNALAQQSWRQLREKYVSLPLTGQERDMVRMFDLWMAGLSTSLDNAQVQNTIMHLQQLRHALHDLRPQYGVNHPADVLYDFYYQWEWVEEISHDQLMCLVEWNEFRDAYHRAARQWQAFLPPAMAYRDHLFPGLATATAQAENARVEMNVALAEFEQLLQQADHSLMAAPSKDVHDQFFYYLAVLTDYPFTAPAI